MLNTQRLRPVKAFGAGLISKLLLVLSLQNLHVMIFIMYSTGLTYSRMLEEVKAFGTARYNVLGEDAI